MDFEIPADIRSKLAELDEFIETQIRPLEQEDDNIRFFDHRREWARTDFDNDGQPRPEWEALLGEMRRRADAAGHLRFGLPVELGGQGGSNLAVAVIREHLAAKGLGLHNDLQNESSIVGNFPFALMMDRFGTTEQKAQFLEASLTGRVRVGFGLSLVQPARAGVVDGGRGQGEDVYGAAEQRNPWQSGKDLSNEPTGPGNRRYHREPCEAGDSWSGVRAKASADRSGVGVGENHVGRLGAIDVL